MRETYVEFVDNGVLVYFPDTMEVAIAKPTLEEVAS